MPTTRNLTTDELTEQIVRLTEPGQIADVMIRLKAERETVARLLATADWRLVAFYPDCVLIERIR